MSGMCQSDLPTFKDNKNIVEIYKEIYLYKNFLPYNKDKEYNSKLNSFSDWNSHGNYEIGDHDKYNNLYSWNNKLSIDFDTDFLTISIVNLIAPVHWIFRHRNFIRLSTGESAPLSRSHEETSSQYTKPRYKLSYYTGEWTGGKLVFPEIKFDYTPESNDLLIFSPDKEYMHFTEEITSGTRYCYVDMLNYHPGYFIG
jgi:hypothetical protein